MHQTLIRVCASCQQEGKGPPPAPNQSHGLCTEHELKSTVEAFSALSAKYRALNIRLGNLVMELLLQATEREHSGGNRVAEIFNRGVGHGFREAAKMIGEVQDGKGCTGRQT